VFVEGPSDSVGKHRRRRGTLWQRVSIETRRQHEVDAAIVEMALQHTPHMVRRDVTVPVGEVEVDEDAGRAVHRGGRHDRSTVNETMRHWVGW
jgi:hypothetical protein